jgi:hypothetical protein
VSVAADDLTGRGCSWTRLASSTLDDPACAGRSGKTVSRVFSARARKTARAARALPFQLRFSGSCFISGGNLIPRRRGGTGMAAEQRPLEALSKQGEAKLGTMRTEVVDRSGVRLLDQESIRDVILFPQLKPK